LARNSKSSIVEAPGSQPTTSGDPKKFVWLRPLTGDATVIIVIKLGAVVWTNDFMLSSWWFYVIQCYWTIGFHKSLDSLGKSQKGTPRHSDLGELWRQVENHRPTPMKIWVREIRILKNSGNSVFFPMDLLVGGFKPSETY
jgi:hypothetical protein